MRSTLAFAVALAFAFVGVGFAAAQDNATAPAGFEFVVGGEPGIHVLLEGRDVAEASTPHDAFTIDPSVPVNVSFSFAPPPNTTWQLTEIRLGVVVSGDEPAEKLTQRQAFDATLPPGSTVYVNRTIDLGKLKSVGTGLFRMRVDVAEADNGTLYAATFFVHVKGNVLLTATGAVVTAASVATGYGLWRIVQDLRELVEARERHKKKEAASKAAAKAQLVAVQAVSLTGGIEGIINAAGNADSETGKLQKRAWIRWTATGLGLGGVTISWAQFLGYVPVDLGATLITTAGAGAAFLTAVLLTVALRNRFARKRREREAREATRTIVPTENERSSESPTFQQRP